MIVDEKGSWMPFAAFNDEANDIKEATDSAKSNLGIVCKFVTMDAMTGTTTTVDDNKKKYVDPFLCTENGVVLYSWKFCESVQGKARDSIVEECERVYKGEKREYKRLAKANKAAVKWEAEADAYYAFMDQIISLGFSRKCYIYRQF